MGYIATDLARIPSAGFDWYVFVLLDGWSDPFRDELARNFDQLAVEVGPRVLVVRGAEPRGFYSGLLESELLKVADEAHRNPPLPALVVSNRTPESMDDSSGIKSIEGLRLMIFPLAERYVKPGSVTDFLRHLATTLQEGSFDGVPEAELKSKWTWLVDCLVLKPNFFGFGIDLNRIIGDIFVERTGRG